MGLRSDSQKQPDQEKSNEEIADVDVTACSCVKNTENYEEIKTMISQVLKSIDVLNKQCSDTQVSLVSTIRDRKELQLVNSQLRNTIDELTKKLDKTRWDGFRTQETLLLGDSLIRDVDQKKLTKTKVVSIPGGKIKDAVDKLQTNQRYRSIVLSIGTNDCSDENLDAEEVIQSYKTLVMAATDRVPSPADVAVSSIPPRTDCPEHQHRVEAFNAALCVIAGEMDVLFINNDTKFKLSDGSVNDGYLLNDGLHLSAKGTNMLSKNLMLEIIASANGNVVKSKIARGKKDAPKQNTKGQESDMLSCPLIGENSSSEHGETQSNGQPSSDASVNDRRAHTPARSTSGRYNDSSTAENQSWQVVQGRKGQRQSSRGQHARSQVNFQKHQDNPCHFCGELNHISRNCRFGEAVSCYSCGQRGHKQKFCEYR